MFNKLILIIVLTLNLISIISSQSVYTVLKVYDGDTVTLKNSSTGNSFRVRVICVDAPEMAQVPWGQKSQARLL